MRYSMLASLAVVAPLLVSARPIRSRGASAMAAGVLQFAHVLEQLETKFYTEGIAKFQDADFTSAGFTSTQIVSQVLTAIQTDEATHTSVLQQALMDNGAQPLMCDFNFDSVLTDVPTMAATARVVEMVGVGAYLGGAPMIDDPVLLDAAASILTVEARHSTLLNLLSGTGSAIPQAFDIPLTPPEVLSIAGGFVSGPCDLGITPTNTLTITNTGSVTTGTLLTFSGKGVDGTDNLFCNMITGGMPYSLNLPLAECMVPEGLNGPVAIWITSDNNPLLNNVIDRAMANSLVAGPALAFIDTSPEVLGQLVRGSGTNSGATSTTTTTITPDQAASIIQGASATATASDSSSTDSSSTDSSSTDSSSSSPSDANSSSGSGSDSSSDSSAPPLPTNFTGESPDGKLDVLGLSMVPRPTDDVTGASASGSAAFTVPTASASDSAASSSASSS